MKHISRTLIALGLAQALLVTPVQAQAPLELALQVVGELAQVNGQALACQELKIAARAKSLMITHAPKTARFGDAYEVGTQQSYSAQVNGTAACPDSTALTKRLDALAQRLQTALPATLSESK
jgi:hypothetical protein